MNWVLITLTPITCFFRAEEEDLEAVNDGTDAQIQDDEPLPAELQMESYDDDGDEANLEPEMKQDEEFEVS